VQTVLPYAMLVVGFVLLVKGADLLVTGAVNLAQRLRISDLMMPSATYWAAIPPTSCLFWVCPL